MNNFLLKTTALLTLSLSPALAVTVRTPSGPFTLPGKAARVVALEYSFLDTLIALGVKPVGAALGTQGGDRGAPPYLRARALDVTSIGSRAQPNLEAILSVKPDLILADNFVHKDLLSPLGKLAPTAALQSRRGSYEEIMQGVLTIGRLVGQEARAQTLVDEQARLLAKSRAFARAKAPGVVLAVSTENSLTLHSTESFVGSLIEKLGRQNLVKPRDGQTQFEVSLEGLAALNPPTLVLFTALDEKPLVREWARNPLWQKLSAVQRGRVYEFDRDLWTRARPDRPEGHAEGKHQLGPAGRQSPRRRARLSGTLMAAGFSLPGAHPVGAKRVLALVPLLALALLALGVLALGLGAVRTPPLEVLRALTGSGDELTSRIVLELRLPRVLVAALTGAMFAASGAILQGVVRNPLASPDLIGVGAGAGLAAVLVLLVFPGAPAWALPWGAFLGAWVGFALVYLLARKGGRVAPVRLALIGVAVGAALGSLQTLVLVRAPDGIGAALAFLTGTIYGADWERFSRVLPWALALLPLGFVLARRLDVLAFGEGVATSLGVRVELARAVLLTVAVGLAGAAVTGSGILGFVGLLAPHLARLLVGALHARLLPLALLIGALLVVAADTLGRALLPPIEIPAGILTTLVGAPYFLWLLKRSR